MTLFTIRVFLQTNIFLGKFEFLRNIAPMINVRLGLALLYSAKLSTCITSSLTQQYLNVSEFLKYSEVGSLRFPLAEVLYIFCFLVKKDFLQILQQRENLIYTSLDYWRSTLEVLIFLLCSI